MSTNVTDTKTLKNDAWMFDKDIQALRKQLKHGLPEDCFLTDDECFGPVNQDGKRKLISFVWRGEDRTGGASLLGARSVKDA